MSKTKIFSCLLLLIPIFSIAQESSETKKQFLTDKEGVRLSGFITIDSEFSQIGNDFAVGTGASVGLIFNRSLYIGAYGTGVVYDLPNLDFTIDINDIEELDSLNNFDFKALGHGGLLIGGVFQPHKIIHGGASVKFGYGDLAMFDYDNDIVTNDFTFIIQPQLEAEINVARWFKIKAAGGYRFATDLRSDLFYDKNYLNSPTGSISLIFGWFGEKKIFENREGQSKRNWFNKTDKKPKRKWFNKTDKKPKRNWFNKNKEGQISL